MIKKYFLIGLITLTTISVIFIFFISRQKRESPQIAPQKPNIPSAITGTLPINIAIDKSNFDFPPELPTLSISLKNIDKTYIESLSNKLGLGTGLNQFDDVNEGVKYYTDDGDRFFVATVKTSIIKYGMSFSRVPVTQSENISNEEITKIATKFITENGLYREDQIKAQPVIYFKEDSTSEGLEETDRKSAQLFQVGFAFKSSSYQIVKDSSEGQQIFVQILPDGTIFNSEILLINDIQEGFTKYPLKTYEDLNTSLNQAKLISLTGAYISPLDLTIDDIQNLKIEKIRLVYFLEKGKENLLQPIYILEGPAEISKSSANYATVYIPAYRDTQN